MDPCRVAWRSARRQSLHRWALERGGNQLGLRPRGSSCSRQDRRGARLRGLRGVLGRAGEPRPRRIPGLAWLKLERPDRPRPLPYLLGNHQLARKRAAFRCLREPARLPSLPLIVRATPQYRLHRPWRARRLTRPNLAKLTVARQIAAIVLAMWKTQEEYD